MSNNTYFIDPEVELYLKEKERIEKEEEADDARYLLIELSKDSIASLESRISVLSDWLGEIAEQDNSYILENKEKIIRRMKQQYIACEQLQRVPTKTMQKISDIFELDEEIEYIEDALQSYNAAREKLYRELKDYSDEISWRLEDAIADEEIDTNTENGPDYRSDQ